jgi:serine-type D-Ala-D-Ala carboxypeptidase (penicillin-binding protein 5/6)
LVVAVLGLMLVGTAPVKAQEPPPAPEITSAAAVVVNASHGDAVVFQRSSTARRAPASLTKLVTALVVRDEYRLEEVVRVSSLVRQPHGSRLGLEPGMEVTVRDLLYGLLLRSGNDAGTALAAHHPAGYDFFLELMNSKARSLGAYDSRFLNPHGLDGIGHYSSARDMALFTREVLMDPVLADMVSTPTHSFPWPNGGSRSFDHHHRLVVEQPGVYGGKTGFTNNAGLSLASIAHTESGSLIVIVLGSDDHYADTRALVDYGQTVASEAAGGGSMDLYGTLDPPPALPQGVGLANVETDPRDDWRWMALVGGLAALTAGSFIWRRRRPAEPPDELEVWLESLSAARRPA